MKRNVIICAIALFCTQAMSYTHSDTQMNALIEEAFRIARENHSGGFSGIIGERCPHDSRSEDFKFELIDRGFSKGLYSGEITNRMKAEHLYPFIGLNPEDDAEYVFYLCLFGM